MENENVGFCGEGKTRVPGEKPLGARERTNNKLNPDVAQMPGCELGSNWWEAGVLYTALPLLPNKYYNKNNANICDNELLFVIDCLPEVLLASVLHPHPVRWRR